MNRNKQMSIEETAEAGHDSDRKQFGNRIRAVWHDSLLTQAIFADTLSVSTVTLLNYMKGERIPDAFFIRSLGLRYNICFDWLLLGDGPMRLDAKTGKAETSNNDNEIKILRTKVEAMEQLLSSKDKTLATMEELLTVYKEKLGERLSSGPGVQKSAQIAPMEGYNDDNKKNAPINAPGVHAPAPPSD